MPICEMCGRESQLVLAEVEGGELNVCPNCVKYGTTKRKANLGPNKFVSKANKFSKTEMPEFKVVNNYSSLIRSARESKDMKQEDFAKFLNEKESILTKWESGSLKPRLDVARRLERVLGIRLVERDVIGKVEKQEKQKAAAEFTLGDFIKTRKRK
ncbi:TIGR00270 family protein [Candidatus Woesearchaeota archaeon]|jgi:putative transcription factor|nr:TIGR00270 family protein [Candidatus Woesearchaeota archaeon]